jgi:hypothetical protein
MTDCANTSSLQGGKRLAFSALLVVLSLTLCEAVNLVLGLAFGKDLFSGQSDYFASINESQFESWKLSPWFDPELGWNTPQEISSHHEKNCLGEEIAYSFAQGRRLDSGSGQIPTVALLGDSYTYGHEISDHETISSAIWRDYHTAALNYGVVAYSPEQTVLKFERLAKEGKLPKTAVLIVMHENIRRTANSLRVVYSTGSDIRFGIKPYMRHGELFPLQFPANYRDYVQEAERRFRDDYWARPDFRFPFTVNLARALFTQVAHSGTIAPFGTQPLSYEYSTDNELRRNLSLIVNRFRASAEAAGIRALVIFIPRNRETYQVSASYAATLGKGVLEFTDPDMDWTKYNLRPDGNCHPSPYGAGRIARFISSALGPE